MNELAGHNLGGYRLEKEIGRGSMGVVYRGKQLALDREVAIKVLPQALARDNSYVARFIREAQIIAGLNHPNIVQIHDAGQQGKLLYFVMEYVQGPNLASLIQLDGTISIHLAVEYAAQIADALDAAYRERNVIHRDIKPENLMLDRWGKIKVMDFGLARALGQQKITVARTLVGSIYYASPEQVWGDPLDNRSDIYALGVVLYEMLTGHRPFNGRSMPELTQTIIRGQFRPPREYNPEIPPALEQILLVAMATSRDQRFDYAATMANRLRMFLQTSTSLSPVTPLPRPAITQKFPITPPPLTSTFPPLPPETPRSNQPRKISLGPETPPPLTPPTNEHPRMFYPQNAIDPFPAVAQVDEPITEEPSLWRRLRSWFVVDPPPNRE